MGQPEGTAGSHDQHGTRFVNYMLLRGAVHGPSPLRVPRGAPHLPGTRSTEMTFSPRDWINASTAWISPSARLVLMMVSAGTSVTSMFVKASRVFSDRRPRTRNSYWRSDTRSSIARPPQLVGERTMGNGRSAS